MEKDIITREYFNEKIEEKLSDILELFKDYIDQFPEYKNLAEIPCLSMSVHPDTGYLSAFSIIDRYAVKSDVEAYRSGTRKDFPEPLFYVDYASSIENGKRKRYTHSYENYVEDIPVDEVIVFDRVAERNKKNG